MFRQKAAQPTNLILHIILGSLIKNASALGNDRAFFASTFRSSTILLNKQLFSQVPFLHHQLFGRSPLMASEPFLIYLFR